MGEGFLDKAYNLDGPQATQALYDAWAASYEAEIGENGYATPGRTAAALRKYAKDPALPLLDFGCGTGLGGLALKLAGFTTLDGLDISPEMIARARDKQIYRQLWQVDPAAAMPVAPASYGLITAIGVIGVGAAPVSTFDTIMRLLAKGGLFAFSFNDHALADRRFEGKLNEYLDCAAARLLFREHGSHLPGINLKSNVYVIEKI